MGPENPAEESFMAGDRPFELDGPNGQDGPISPDQKNDADWQAWRYVAREMSSRERDAFESLLLESQPLRECVAEARELWELVVTAEAEPVTRAEPARSSWSRRVQWMALGAAAALLLALGQQWLRQPTFAPTTPTTPDVKPELALAWSETRDWVQSEADADFGWSVPGMAGEEAQAGAADTLTSAGLTPSADPLAEVTAPDWMVAALRAERERETTEPSEDI